MSGYLASIHSLAAFMELEGKLDRNRFELFAAEEVQLHPGIIALEWLPRVTRAERLDYERSLSALEGRPAGITFGTTVNPQRAQEKDQYFPITLIFPRTAAANVIGFNGYSQKELKAALDSSRDTGEPVSASKFRLIEPTFDGFAVPIYVPVYKGLVYRGRGNQPSVEERRAALAGFVLGIIELNTALEAAIRQINGADANIQFYDLSAAPGKKLLHFHRAPNEPISVQPLSEQDALTPEAVKFVAQFPFTSRKWAIVCTPTSGYLRANTTWQPWAVLFVGVLFGLSLSAYLSLHMSYTARAEQLVAELFQNTARLNREVEIRKKAEEEITRLNASLEARVEERTEALRESEERYALAARGSKDGLWDWNLATGRIYFSPRWKNMLGYSEDEISPDPSEWFKRMHRDDAAAVRAAINAHCAGQSTHLQTEHRMLHKDGTYRWMLSRGVAVRDERGRATRIAGSQTDVTADRVADPLTGLPNRLFLAEKLRQAIQRIGDSRAHQFAVLFLDLDRFKVVNDSLGHKTGDLLLCAIAARLQSCIRLKPEGVDSIVATRLGGDEFAVLLDGIYSSRVAMDFAETLQNAMKPYLDLEGRQIFSSFSIGVALGGPDSDANEILRDADTAMYHAKTRGKQKYVVFDAAMRQRAVDRMQMESDLRAAVPRGELLVHYQPKVSLVTGKVVEFEALVRWNHPVRGLVYPMSFIPLADETGLILSIGEWVLLQACRQLADWRRRFKREVGVSVNISGRQFESMELVGQVRYILNETGIPASSLSLEVTESVFLENPESAIRQLNELREIGIGLKIDDFGTGFSSLSYLHRLPFNELKIDRSFIAGFGSKAEAKHIVHTIILLARLLGMKVVAEGVETEDQLNQLTALSCDYAQGNFFSWPLAPGRAEVFLSADCPPFFRMDTELQLRS
jgi:diguanylate cyclase (GGDEF)-like protein/PAS domain S-box-containing protein